MATDVVMPQMGESIAEGTIVRWIKKVGDKVDRDEPLFEISTDKVDAEIPSPAAGVADRDPGQGRRDRAGEQRRRGDRRRRRAAGRRAGVRSAPPAAPRRRRRPGRRREPPKPQPQADGTTAASGRPRLRRSAPASTPPSGRGDLDRGDHPPAFVAARAQDRQGAQRRHLAAAGQRYRAAA